MASQPSDPHTFGFAYRVAVPTLVHLMPFGHEFAFSALAAVHRGVREPQLMDRSPNEVR